ncbi:DUF4167 domain-containing protein [Dichotomicrobium thermohalophilum]|uniref:Uncharacterized protein DUF4167 n=1 Tax=Dichotomicrobium thermohalophilum TaxID=933063 RepID=A0A397Q288_9HYPH|nr:DUF4167 domain-containing protein [Dichotomicrobium thermohalophilum]RIA55486.1 uncharacterized protein DUF4167 [Dichotomicrobium thermohalophilum]
MRQGQQNRRGRNRSGRKPQSALTRNFESNGPNVKIRGTAAHIAEKYLALARDALSSGDIIVAESYFQHAEHYNRIIMAAQAERQNGAERPAQQSGNGRDHGDDFDVDSAEEEPALAGDGAAQPSAAAEAEQPQANRRRKSGNGSGNSEAKAEGSGSEGQKQSRGAQARRKRQKVESTGARQKAAKANGASANGASASPDDSASEGYSA